MERLSESCRQFDRDQWDYVEGRLPRHLREEVDRHLDVCNRCRGEFRSAADVRAALRSLPRVQAPADLHTRLRVGASRVRALQADHGSWWQRAWADLQLHIDNAMRPFALPAAGGIVSAILLFSMIAPPLAVRGNLNINSDVPTVLYTEASVKSAPPLDFETEDIEVELTIDEEGRMIDYRIADAQRKTVLKSPEFRRSLENHLLFTRFTPATSFGQATSGKIRITFRTSGGIDVRG